MGIHGGKPARRAVTGTVELPERVLAWRSQIMREVSHPPAVLIGWLGMFPAHKTRQAVEAVS